MSHLSFAHADAAARIDGVSQAGSPPAIVFSGVKRRTFVIAVGWMDAERCAEKETMK